MKKRNFVALALVALLTASAAAFAQTSFPVTQGKVYKFEKVADGVYYATGGIGSNDVVIVNDQDVMLVDDGSTPATARALVADIKLITPKPVRTVVNTHFHYDHTDGNSIFGPEVQIIAHEFVREAISNFDVLHREPFKSAEEGLPAQIEALKKQVEQERFADKLAVLTKQLSDADGLRAGMKEVKPTPPNVTYNSKLILHKGAREIQLLFLGRGHTAGDTFVYLPKEKIICTGDAEQGARLAYMGDAYFDEWVGTLDQLKKLDFNLILGGHGVPFRDKELITAFQGYLKDVVGQVTALRTQGVKPEDAAKRVDLTAHAKSFPQIQGPGADIRGVRRIYQWMDEKEKK